MVTVGIIFVLIVIIAVLANGIEDYNSKNTIKFDKSFGELQLPIITFLNNDKEFNFLVDTGANMSIINSYYLQEFKYISLETTGTIFGMEGNVTNTNFVSVVLQKGKDSFLNCYQAVDISNSFGRIEDSYSVKIHGVIGNDFLVKYGCLIDYKNNRVKYEN